jgi:ABC-type transport system involved in multi-copper enzyme maturation permease subunit
MPIREKGYYQWEGELKTSYVKWLPIFLTGIKGVYKKRFSKFLFAFSALTFLIFLAAVYVSTKPELRMLTRLVKMIQTDAALFNAYYTNGFLLFMMVIISLFAGAEQISGDLKFNSFTLYLSRPLSRLDYVKGKFSIVLFYLLVFTLVPGLLLIIFKIIFTGSFSVPLQIFLAAIIFPILVSLFFASLSIMLSSLSTNARLVKILIIVIYLMSNAIARMFHDIFKSRSSLYFSIEENIKQFGEFVFGTQRGNFYMEGLISGCILLGLTLLFFTIVMIRINRAEV